MLNIAIGIVLFTICSYIGLRYKKKCTARAAFYSELFDFCLYLTEQIAYSKTPLPTIFRSFSLGKNSEISQLLLDFCDELQQSEPKEYVIKYLNEYEISEVLIFFRSLGKTDAENQLIKLAESKQRIKNKKELTQSEQTSKGKLYFKLAVIIGIALLIIVV